MGLDNLPDKYDAILSWMSRWARKLYPHWHWTTCTDPRGYNTLFWSDSIAIKARQVQRQGGRVVAKRGIIMGIGLEDLFRLRRLSAYEKVDVLKANLHIMLQQAKIVPEGYVYPSYYWRRKDELEFAANG